MLLLQNLKSLSCLILLLSSTAKPGMPKLLVAGHSAVKCNVFYGLYCSPLGQVWSRSVMYSLGDQRSSKVWRWVSRWIQQDVWYCQFDGAFPFDDLRSWSSVPNGYSVRLIDSRWFHQDRWKPFEAPTIDNIYAEKNTVLLTQLVLVQSMSSWEHGVYCSSLPIPKIW